VSAADPHHAAPAPIEAVGDRVRARDRRTHALTRDRRPRRRPRARGTFPALDSGRNPASPKTPARGSQPPRNARHPICSAPTPSPSANTKTWPAPRHTRALCLTLLHPRRSHRRRPPPTRLHSCHPGASTSPAPPSPRLLGGLTTPEIARAFLNPRAHHRPAHRPAGTHLSPRNTSLRSPGAPNSPARLAPPRGDLPHLQPRATPPTTAGLIRPALCEDALASAASSPNSPAGTESRLVALMEIQASAPEPHLARLENRFCSSPTTLGYLLIRRGGSHRPQLQDRQPAALTSCRPKLAALPRLCRTPEAEPTGPHRFPLYRARPPSTTSPSSSSPSRSRLQWPKAPRQHSRWSSLANEPSLAHTTCCPASNDLLYKWAGSRSANPIRRARLSRRTPANAPASRPALLRLI